MEELGDKRVLAKLNRWKQKFGDAITVTGEDDEQEYFNEDYTVVARILDETFDDKEDQHYGSYPNIYLIFITNNF